MSPEDLYAEDLAPPWTGRPVDPYAFDALPPPPPAPWEGGGFSGGWPHPHVEPVRGFRDRLALALADLPQPPMRGPGSAPPAAAFLSGLASGASRVGEHRISEREKLNQALGQAAHEENARNLEATRTAAAERRAIADDERTTKREKELVDYRAAHPAARTERAPDTISTSDVLALPGSLTAGDVGKAWSDPDVARRVAGKTPQRPPSQFMAEFDPQATWEAMHRGDLPTDPTGYTRGQWGAIASVAAKNGDAGFKSRQLDWIGTRTYWGTRNRQQQLNILQNLERVSPSLDLVDQLSGELSAVLARTPAKVLNKANMTAAENGLYGRPAAIAAQRLHTQINDTVFELQQVYGNGYSPTDQALRLASENLNSDWAADVLKSNVDLARKNVAIRRSSVASVGPSTPENPGGFLEGPPAAADPAPAAAPSVPPKSAAPPNSVYMESADGTQRGWVPAGQKNQAINRGWKLVKVK